MNMKKVIVILVAMMFGALQMNAQKIGYFNSEKVLSAIPAYKSAQQQLESYSKQFQDVIDAEYAKIETLYNRYQQQKGNLTAQARQIRENEIIQKEQDVKKLQQEYFGQDGQMQQHSERLMQPIMEKVDAAIEKVARGGGFALVLDVASIQGVAYKNEQYDLSDAVIKALEY
jgi:outer membrane protein